MNLQRNTMSVSVATTRIASAIAAALLIVACNGDPLNTAAIGTSQSPQITSEPQNASVTVGNPATFTVTATGTAPLTYQWFRSGDLIAGATSSSYQTPPTTAADNGATFAVQVSNSLGTITSNSATLTVN
jgi:hypothetical protein